MFDVGFSEMLVIGIVALVVIGPERLPKVARTIGHLMGRAQRYVNDVKRDIDREMQIDELRKLQSEMQDAARSIESSVTTQVGEVKSELDKAQATLNQFEQQTADLTRLDDPLAVAAPTNAEPTASAALAHDASGGVVASVEAKPLEQAGLAQMEASQQLGSEGDTLANAEHGGGAGAMQATGSNDLLAGQGQPQIQAQTQAQTQQQNTDHSHEPAAQAQEQAKANADTPAQQEPAQQHKSSDTAQQVSRQAVDHVFEDYSEGVMAPNTTIKPEPVAPAGGAGGAGGAAVRQVLVHVDVPPVT